MENQYSGVIENEEIIEKIFEIYQNEPHKIDKSWKKLFEHIEAEPIRKKYTQGDANTRLEKLIEAYRNYGHLKAQFNPLQDTENETPKELELSLFGFGNDDLQKEFQTEGLLNQPQAPLKEIIRKLDQIYCGKVGYEFKNTDNPELIAWIQEKIERHPLEIPVDQKRMILDCLNKSELLESFLQTKYTGQKRFSLEGGETLIPILETIIERGVELGLSEFVLGMAHRGRLNVLSNIMRKSHAELFAEFSEDYIPEAFEGTGDVKYHKGFFSEIIALNGQNVKITLSPNPSHLESVDAVVEGQTYAKQLLYQDSRKEKVLPLLIHGDAAIAGQGVVYETLQLSKLKNYDTGGTVHIVINNQIGFTTLPSDAKSTRYCTDIAKTFNAPVFHVNAEDPESCIFIANLAIEIRQKFHCEVFIDMNCYRKYGHNETDEPAFTQPLEYQKIRKKHPIRESYRDVLIQQGILEQEIAESLEAEFKSNLQKALDLSKTKIKSEDRKVHSEIPENQTEKVPNISKDILKKIAERISTIPDGFNPHQKLAALVKERFKMTLDGPDAKPLDWGMAETLAYGSLLWEGYEVRLAGQDSCRGTFSHRHGMWVDQNNQTEYFPLQHLKEGQGNFQLINSPLSEFAALGFEYGYSVANSNSLVIWEAQFGDFANGGQVIIDQFISTGQQKWNQRSSLTLFLPHGYEGQGPEHSSARIERFLSLAGHDNMRIAYPTTPAQIFHLLRKQITRKYRRPLVIFTPKGLLRHPKCISRLDDLASGDFLTILDDPTPPQQVHQLVFCTGRIYYDLAAKREELNHSTAIIRVEKLYPLDTERLQFFIQQYSSATKILWVQEEPYNMGAWSYMEPFLQKMLPQGKKLEYVGRERGASPAVGSHAWHRKELDSILKSVFYG